MADIFDLFRKIEKKPQDLGPVEYLVVGLGNPGTEYANTRHNAGFRAVDRIAENAGVRIDRAKFHALVTECTYGGKRTLLMKPQTYMNNSGEAVGEAAKFYKIPPEKVIVLCDEISFDVGLLRIRRKGSAGGHNGLKSIIAFLGSEEFPRIKIGIGKKPNPDYDLADWVLSGFSAQDNKTLADVFDRTAAATEIILRGNIDDAMMKYSK